MLEKIVQTNKSLQSKLTKSFGVPCDLVVRDDQGWYRIITDRGATAIRQPAAPDIAAVLDRHFDARNTACVPFHDNSYLLIVPGLDAVINQSALVVPVACIDCTTIQRLTAVLAQDQADRSRLELSEAQLTGFMRQVTADFEELTWLRTLGTHIELCDVQRTIADVAAAILPSLREIIAAEAIMLFQLPANGDPAYEPVYTTGVCRCGAEALEAVLPIFESADRSQPLVRNIGFGEEMNGRRVDVRNFVLLPVGQGTYQSGWLLAVNKQQSDSDNSPCAFRDAQTYSETEFGTFEAGMLAAAATLLGSHARNVAMFQEQDDLFQGLVKALINSIDAKDTYTCGHSDRVAQMARRLGQELQLPEAECERIYMMGLLHDIGKIGIPDSVLSKPGKLTDEEFALIKKHPEIGHSIVQHLSQLHYALPGILHHHESYDGRGYPGGLSGENIPFYGRLLAVVDAYDAMTSDRPYRPGMPTTRAEEILRSGAGQQWDPQMVNKFFSALPDMHAICGFNDNPTALSRRQTNAGMVVRAAESKADRQAVPPLDVLVPI